MPSRWTVLSTSRASRTATALEAIGAVENHPVLVVTEPEREVAWTQRLEAARPGHSHRLRDDSWDPLRWSSPWVPAVAPAPALCVVSRGNVPWQDAATAGFGAVVVDVDTASVLELASAVADLATQHLLLLCEDPRVAATAAALSGSAFRDLDAETRLAPAVRARLTERVVPWDDAELELLKRVDLIRPDASPSLERALRSGTATCWNKVEELFLEEMPAFYDALEKLLSDAGDPAMDVVFDAVGERGAVAVCVWDDAAAGNLEEELDNADVTSARATGARTWETVSIASREPARVFILPDAAGVVVCPPVDVVVHLDLPPTLNGIVRRMHAVESVVGPVPHVVVLRPQEDVRVLEVLGFR